MEIKQSDLIGIHINQSIRLLVQVTWILDGSLLHNLLIFRGFLTNFDDPLQKQLMNDLCENDDISVLRSADLEECNLFLPYRHCPIVSKACIISDEYFI